MDKSKKIFLIFQSFVGIVSFLACFFIILDCVHFIPVCGAYRYSIEDIQPLLYKTSVGKVVSYMQTTETSNFFVLAKEDILAFLRYMHPVCILFLILLLISLGFYCFSPILSKKTFYSYIPYFGKIMLCYLTKFLIAASIFGIFFNDTMKSIGTSLAIIGYTSILFNGFLIFYCVLFILKWIFALISFIRFKTLENPQ